MEFYAFISLLIVLLLSLLLLKGFFLGSFTESKRKPYYPISTSVFQRLYNFGRLHHYQTDLAHRHKNFRVVAIGHSDIFTTDPANVEYILKTNFSNYVKGTYHYDKLSDLLGDGIFTVDGEKWRRQRKIASYEFSTKVLRDFSSLVFRSNAAKLAHVISNAATSNQTMDIQDLFMKSTLDSIFKVGFGTELNSLCGSSEEASRFAEAFDDSSELIFRRYVDPLWKLKKRFNIGSEAMLNKKRKVIDEFVYKLINSKKKQLSGGQDSMKKEDILSRFLVLSHEDPENINDRYLRDIILNFIIAGKDTTALTLSWFFYMLCKYPAIQEKIAREVEEATQAKDTVSIDEFTTRVTEEALSKMHYLHAALTETLRLYPPVPVDGKFCLSDDTLPDGFAIKGGDSITYGPYAMGRMKFIWGEDAEVFRPERWIDDDGIFQPESPFKFTAFQAGPRICLGKEFAYRQMKIFAAILLRFFRFELNDEKKVVKYRTMLTLHIDQGLYVRAYHA
ncbi:cytochrome P450 704C1-like isoform X1 [Magnolia sinica]|uniref:cytochrome P450 704C1-like isoform X1 n=1 Tax=Magnolia sinica TaxID=86752 RepID=UPI00265B55E4|nr:cytochrome P450 704C1-like isoform X1 [Magnolia sinica]